MAKKWTSCLSCDYQSECNVCLSRLSDYDKKSLAAEDVGCYDFEMIKKQIKSKEEKMQLKLFKM